MSESTGAFTIFEYTAKTAKAMSAQQKKAIIRLVIICVLRSTASFFFESRKNYLLLRVIYYISVFIYNIAVSVSSYAYVIDISGYLRKSEIYRYIFCVSERRGFYP